MKNKEKYAKEIIEIACNGDVLAVSKVTGKPIGCKNISCKDCNNYNDFLICEEKRLREWSESEYIKKPVISKRDREFLDYLGKELKYIVRNKSDNLIVYQNSAGKYEDEWMIDSGAIKSLQKLNIDFPMVNSEPWLIEDLKKLGVVEEYGTD